MSLESYTAQNVRPLEGLTAVVTGAGRGIGRAIALELARAGANLLLVARTAAQLEETAVMAKELGVQAQAQAADVSQAEGVKAVVDAATEHFGGAHILVNNAGITRDNLLMRMKEEDWDSVLDVNLKSAFLLSKAFCRAMMKQRFGRIVNVASVVGVTGNAGQANYVASKAGLIGLTKTLALELASRNITCNAVAPGYIATDMTEALPEATRQAILAKVPLERPGCGEDVAQAVRFLVSPQSSYITGQVLHVDGGMAM